MQIYWNKRKFLHTKKSLTPTGLVWYTNMAAVSLFWYTNMVAVTSCENVLFFDFQPDYFKVTLSNTPYPDNSRKRKDSRSSGYCQNWKG